MMHALARLTHLLIDSIHEIHVLVDQSRDRRLRGLDDVLVGRAGGGVCIPLGYRASTRTLQLLSEDPPVPLCRCELLA